MMPKKVILPVINDLTIDQRMHKICTTLTNHNFEVTLVGTHRTHSIPLGTRAYKTKRLNLWIQKGALSYMEFNIRLFFFLLFNKTDIITANDLDTLLPCFLVSKLKRKKLIYDTHEYFTEQPELSNRPRVKKFWLTLEKFLFPKLQYISTVNQSLADIYQKLYKIDNIKVIKNLPHRIEQVEPIAKKNIVIYQGNVNLSRGIDIMLKALTYLDDVEFWCVGPGDLLEDMKILAHELGVEKKVKFWGSVPFQQLKNLTLQAKIGISIEQPIGLNSTLCLPNKLMDYIQARIPVIVSNLPEMSKLVEQYELGIVIKDADPLHLSMEIKRLLNDEVLAQKMISNCELVSHKLCWEQEEKTLLELYQ